MKLREQRDRHHILIGELDFVVVNARDVAVEKCELVAKNFALVGRSRHEFSVGVDKPGENLRLVRNAEISVCNAIECAPYEQIAADWLEALKQRVDKPKNQRPLRAKARVFCTANEPLEKLLKNTYNEKINMQARAHTYCID